MSRVNPTTIRQPTRERKSSDILNEINVRSRMCYKFEPKKNDPSKTCCVCNREEGDHMIKRPDTVKDEQIEKGPSEESDWDMRHNTYEKVNPEHGYLLLNGAPCVQLALDTPVEKVEKILLQAWKLSPPRLIMSIIGGAKYFTLSDRLETNFINGIINVAVKSDAWLFTNGYNVGIVQLVGQAISKFKFTHLNKQITAIGICKWGSIKNIENMVTNRSNTLEDNQHPKKRECGERDLELNHSHYLLLDDGTVRSYDIKDYRTRLAVQIGKLQDENDFPLPVVTIVVEGGKDTIANIYYDLKESIPVVIIGGSGRVADLFKRWLLYTKKFDNITNEPEWERVYDIDELKKENTSPSNSSKSSEQNGQSNSTPTTTPHTRIDLNTSLHKLEEKFNEYKDQLKKDVCGIISHDDDDLSKTKREKQSPNGSKDRTNSEEDTVIHQVMFCLQPAVRSNITVFNLNSDSYLSETIFRSICRARQRLLEKRDFERKYTAEKNQKRRKPPYTEQMKQRQLQSYNDIHKKDEGAQRTQLLELAMSWDCIDVAKELILKNSLDNILNKEEDFIHALTDNLPTFVYEFIKLGIDPSTIFFPNGDFPKDDRYKSFIKNLYTRKAVNSDKTDLSHFIQGDDHVREKCINTVGTLNDILATLIGDYMHQLYFNKQGDEDEYRLRHGLIDKKEQDKETGDEQQKKLNNKKKQSPYDYIMRDLFLWAILINRIDMAKVFLSHMKYRICPALIATKILKQYHRKAVYGKLKDSYLKSAEYFEQYAINCLDKCDDHDVDQACDIVLQRNELYGYVTCLQVAADANDKLFIATPCCVQAMDNVWYDKIRPEKSLTNILTILISFFTFGLLAPILVTFRTSEEESIDEPLEQTLEYYGINYSDQYALEHPHYSKSFILNRYIHRLINFHQALCVKYFYHIINYLFFLLLFSYVLLFNFQPPTNTIPSIHWTEILTIILVLCMLIEEIRYFFSLDSITWSGKLESYFRDFFKPMTAIGFVLFFIGLVLRFSDATTEYQFTAARIVMAIDLEIWWLRSLAFIIVIPFLGPNLVAIGKMLKDLGFFMCIIAIVMIGYGVSSRSMVYYPIVNNFTTATGGLIDTSFDGRSIFRQIIYPVYYLMYGEFDDQLSDLDKYPNAAWSIATQVLLAIQMLFVNILLINLLIAIFSKRYDQVYDETKNICHFQQYFVTREYYTRSPFFPPISLFYDIWCLCRMIFYFMRWKCFNKTKHYRAKVFKIIPIHENLIRELYEFEGASTYEYAHNEVKVSTKSTTESDLFSTVKNGDVIHNYDKTNISRHNYKKIQDDLIRLDTSIERIQEEFKKSIEDIKGELQQSVGVIKVTLDKLILEKIKTS